MSTKVIRIEISGPVQSGKSAVLASIRTVLESYGYCVAIPDSEERNNPSKTICDAVGHERPKKEATVFIITETVTRKETPA